MSLSEHDNYLRTVNMTGPEWIPAEVVISDASWTQLREELEDVLARHPLLFPDFEKGRLDFDEIGRDDPYSLRAGEHLTDNWGCVWTSSGDGMEGQVELHPLDKWEKLETYRAPDPMTLADRTERDWDEARRNIEQAKSRDKPALGNLFHGFLLMRLWYLRGFDNLMLDIATEEPRLQQLIELVNKHNKVIVDQWLSMGAEEIYFGEDLGTQTASIISPKAFARWILPAYQELMLPCRRAGCRVYLHSDGYVMELIDYFIEAGVTIINLQDLCNGIDAIARDVKGRMCIWLDIDRQRVVPFGTRKDIRELIEEEVRKLGSPQGGLGLIAGIYPPTPAENVDALCDAIEQFRTYRWRK